MPLTTMQFGNTAAHLAARYGHAACLELLVAAKVDLNAKDQVRQPLLGLSFRGCGLDGSFVWAILSP